ncbi:PREDICTED: mucin-6-like [Nicotiana attenuata]|uniref:mucin-6-like n=1 Tax=Nicotiana attenuata TaxID=49451 RepID=UPI0009058D2B|nr:PREDICTED: mucin-6-like [Nicotiana attenuata]
MKRFSSLGTCAAVTAGAKLRFVYQPALRLRNRRDGIRSIKKTPPDSFEIWNATKEKHADLTPSKITSQTLSVCRGRQDTTPTNGGTNCIEFTFQPLLPTVSHLISSPARILPLSHTQNTPTSNQIPSLTPTNLLDNISPTSNQIPNVSPSNLLKNISPPSNQIPHLSPTNLCKNISQLVSPPLDFRPSPTCSQFYPPFSVDSSSALTSSYLSPIRYNSFLCNIPYEFQNIQSSTSPIHSRLVSPYPSNVRTTSSPLLPSSTRATTNTHAGPYPFSNVDVPYHSTSSTIRSPTLSPPILRHSPHTIPTLPKIRHMVTRSQIGNLKPRVLPYLRKTSIHSSRAYFIQGS